MTPQIGLLLFIIAAALVLFSLERISADVIALGTLLALILTGLVPANQAFAGFGSDVVMMILGLLILTAALLRTGVVEMSGRALLRLTGEDSHRVLVVITDCRGIAFGLHQQHRRDGFFSADHGGNRRARPSQPVEASHATRVFLHRHQFGDPGKHLDQHCH